METKIKKCRSDKIYILIHIAISYVDILCKCLIANKNSLCVTMTHRDFYTNSILSFLPKAAASL